MGRAFFTVIAAIAQLERELIVERVKNGLKNAKAKGKHIGRQKTRPSELIRALLRSGMTLRQAAKVARCSHGSISLEKKLMKLEEEQMKQQITTSPANGTPAAVIATETPEPALSVAPALSIHFS
jgi:DNA invertase Pin-like site-specific DNA recombinase